MQVTQSNNTSFGINLIKFEDKASKELFQSKNRFIGNKAMANMWNEIKQMKPQKGPDIDVYIGQAFKDDKFSTLTCRKDSGDILGKAFAIIEGTDHSSKSIIKAFKKIIRSVDEYRA
ncbi:hypothetical protein IJ732_02375 [bacterium]|nr:hypothetical protein [bacterium]